MYKGRPSCPSLSFSLSFSPTLKLSNILVRSVTVTVSLSLSLSLLHNAYKVRVHHSLNLQLDPPHTLHLLTPAPLSKAPPPAPPKPTPPPGPKPPPAPKPPPPPAPCSSSGCLALEAKYAALMKTSCSTALKSVPALDAADAQTFLTVRTEGDYQRLAYCVLFYLTFEGILVVPLPYMPGG